MLSQGSGYANHTLSVPLLSFYLRIRSCWNEMGFFILFFYLFVWFLRLLGLVCVRYLSRFIPPDAVFPALLFQPLLCLMC